MKPLNLLALILIPLGLVMAFVPKNTTKKYKLTAAQLLKETKTGSQFLSPDEVADKLIKKDPSIQMIDVRTPSEFQKFSLPGAINIPLADLLNEKWTEILNQEARSNVFYSTGSLDANQAWLITRQMGYQNNFVLQGGLNYWFEVIMNPVKPANISPNEELAKYEFRKGASQALGGGNSSQISNSTTGDSKSSGTKTETKKKKKGASGGC
jgi:sulfur-carrier protein adenylyltransferase/sulfurtransferase